MGMGGMNPNMMGMGGMNPNNINLNSDSSINQGQGQGQGQQGQGQGKILFIIYYWVFFLPKKTFLLFIKGI